MRDDFDIAPECGAFALIALIGALFFINPSWGTMVKMLVMVTPAATIYLLPLLLSLGAEAVRNRALERREEEAKKRHRPLEWRL